MSHTTAAGNTYSGNLNPLLAGLFFCVPDFKSMPPGKASFCLRIQTLSICFATVGEQLEDSPQAFLPSSLLSFTSLTQSECCHAPSPTPGIQPDCSITLYFAKTNVSHLLEFSRVSPHLTHVCATLRSEDNRQGSALSFDQVGPRDRTQVFRFSSKHPYLLSHPTPFLLN